MNKLHLICGLPGAGKTTLSKQLEAKEKAFRFCPDDWIKAIIKDPNDKEELDRLRDPVEQLQWTLAQRLIDLNVDVILENGFWSREERLKYCENAKRLGTQVIVHFLSVSKQELWKRIEKRNADPNNDSFCVSKELLEESFKCFTPPNEMEAKSYNEYIEYKS